MKFWFKLTGFWLHPELEPCRETAEVAGDHWDSSALKGFLHITSFYADHHQGGKRPTHQQTSEN